LCQALQALGILCNLPRFARVVVSNNTIALPPMFPLLQVLIAMNISFREHHPPVQLPPSASYKSAPSCCIEPMAAMAIVVAPAANTVCVVKKGSTMV
jgi:hypothetical protein